MQKLLMPWNFKQLKLNENYFIRNDILLSVKSNFTLDFIYFYKKFYNPVNEMLSDIDRPKFTHIKSIYGLDPRTDYISSCNLIVNKFCTDLMYLTSHLILDEHPVDVVKRIKCDIDKLPSFILDIIQFINSHRYNYEFLGTDSSVIHFEETNVKFIFPKELSDSGKDVKHFLKVYNRVKIFCDNIGLEVSNCNINDLFVKHDRILNCFVEPGKIDHSRVDDTLIHAGRECDEVDLQLALFTRTVYTFDNRTCIFTIDTKVAEGDITDTLQLGSTESNLISKYLYNPNVTKSAIESKRNFGINKKVLVEGFGKIKDVEKPTKVSIDKGVVDETENV